MSLPGAIDGMAKIKNYKVIAYTLQGCVHCTHLHELLDRCSISNDRITYVDVGKDISKEDFVAQFPEAGGYPHVIINGKTIGGLVETAKFLLKKKLVSSNKNE
jgi:glutaredoxin|tara:strand:- start:46 stop:354 length:309 start_codon:yes stop_codon:yes gene_type:complete